MRLAPVAPTRAAPELPTIVDLSTSEMLVSPIAFLLPLAFLVLAWFLFIRPQGRRARELRDLQRSLEVGDEVVLTSGFFATVVAVADDHLMVELAEGTTVKVARAAVGMLAAPAGYVDEDAAPTEPDRETETGSTTTGETSSETSSETSTETGVAPTPKEI